MKVRKLRIAWSVACLFLCVVFLVFWIRSRFRYELVEVQISSARMLCVSSIPGRIDVTIYETARPKSRKWSIASYDLDQEIVVALPKYVGLGFGIHRDKNSWGIHAPDWCAIAFGGVIAALPWLPWRFRLRTLLTATTLIALVLGLVVYAASK